MQQGGFYFEKTSDQKTPSFAARSVSNRLKAERLHFAEITGGIDYSNRRVVLTAYGGIRYLYGSQGSLTAIVEDDLTGIKTVHEDFVWLNTGGLNRIYGILGGGIGYRLTRRLGVTGGFEYQAPAILNQNASSLENGYAWSGRNRSVYPFLKLQYRIYGN